MLIRYSTRFIRKLKKLDPALRVVALEKVELFKNIANHEKLGVHKLHGPLAGSHSFSISYDLRIVFDWLGRSEVLFTTIGTHDEVY